jgi:chemotaxis protein CheZ
MPAVIESPPPPKFTADLRRAALRACQEHEGPLPLQNNDVAEERHREVMDVLQEVRSLLADGGAPRARPDANALAGPGLLPGAPAEASIFAGSSTDEELRRELTALHAAITKTKQEIAALREMGKPPSHLATATDELDAVVHATETATECILAASERIDELLTGLRNQASVEETAGIDEIGEQVTRIFESCNFQDITGQRITKVVNALKFVEERVERMIAVLGGEGAIDEAAKETKIEEKAADDESHLLCGPQLDQHKISQDDIDAFSN